jgi:hypothetical protein
VSLFPYLKIKISSLSTIKGSVVLPLVMLQLAAWYPFLSQIQDDMNRHIRQKDRVNHEWERVKQQAIKLHTIGFIDEPWARHHVVATQTNIPTKWSLEGIASVAEWQGLLEKIEVQFAVDLLSVYWQREDDGQWLGRFLFNINVPKANREYHNWLPSKLRAYRFERKDWHLLSTVRTDESTSALVTYKKSRYWVRKGSWLPEAGLSVNAVSFDQVILVAKDGSKQSLIIREADGQDD